MRFLRVEFTSASVTNSPGFFIPTDVSENIGFPSFFFRLLAFILSGCFACGQVRARGAR